MKSFHLFLFFSRSGKTPLKAACCCTCPGPKKLECMESCLDTAGYDDMDDQNQKVYMSYCGFACQTCEHEKVPMADVNGGGTANALGHINSQGTEDGTPPGWWMTTMSAALSKVKAKSAIRL